ncbi:MAG TPA: carbohydrate ABC transporter permease [Actinokineospora sp.]|jgi:multiple sugar transport system permease protein|nr:carbohydrate ABC transporter permease [Actinokineospora sp.]
MHTRPLGRAAGAFAVITVFGALLVLLVSGSLHVPGLPPPVTPDLVPDPLSTEGYGHSVELGGLARATLNSMLVCLIAVPVSVLVAATAGFALTQVSPRTARVVITLSLVALMVPAISLLVPKFALFRALDLTGTLAPLIAPALIATSPLYPLVYYLAFRNVPAELYDACRLEDMSPLRTWWQVGMPLVRPVTAGIAALTFVLTWSNFLDPLVFLYERDTFTLPLALRSLATLDPTDFPIFLAGAVIATVPVLVVIAVAQRGPRLKKGHRG